MVSPKKAEQEYGGKGNGSQPKVPMMTSILLLFFGADIMAEPQHRRTHAHAHRHTHAHKHTHTHTHTYTHATKIRQVCRSRLAAT